MGAATFRSFRDLPVDRRHLYPVHHGAEGELSRDCAADRGVVRRDRGCRAEAGVAGAIRSLGRGPLSGAGLERRDARRCRGEGGAAAGAGARGGGRRTLYYGRAGPRLAAVAVPEGDLAWVRLARRGLPLYGYTRPDRFDIKKLEGERPCR